MMKTVSHPSRFRRGASLVEVMVSIGVLAIVTPLSLAALLQAGESGSAARAETRAPLIVENCMAELNLARKGFSEYLPTLEAGKKFGDGDVLCLAFGGDGKLLGKVDPGAYEKGTKEIANQDAVFLAKLSGVEDESRKDFPLMLTVKVSIERPAVAPRDSRRAMDFYTKLP